jgi:hypothetical protein
VELPDGGVGVGVGVGVTEGLGEGDGEGDGEGKGVGDAEEPTCSVYVCELDTNGLPFDVTVTVRL